MAGFWRPGDVLPGVSHGDISSERDTSTNGEQPSVMYNPNHRLPLHLQRERLPVFAHRKEILYAVETHATTILVGATGSGKTTQVPQYLVEANWASRTPNSNGLRRMIACTQPRRIAAITIAERVAKEMGTSLGHEVGYAVRFEEKWDPDHTKIKFCTDGMLLRETMVDPLLTRYSVIMLDEAHERNLETDMLLGLIKKIQKKRLDLRVIVSSATLQVDTFLRFFRIKKKRKFTETKADFHLKDVVAISVEGRQFSVDIQYLNEPASNYLEKTIETTLAIDAKEGPGDVLIFLPGQEEIDYVVRNLNERGKSHLVPMPFYASLPLQMQQNVFLPLRGFRKVIVATTIAETSVTLEGIVYVIDSCFVKLAFFNPLTGIESLITTLISKAAAKQRAGRAGRIQAGKCFRLCTEHFYQTFLKKDTIPQIQRTNLSRIVLYLLSMGIQNLAHFDFISPPSAEALIRGLELLYSLGVINEKNELIEPLGTQIAEFPVEPTLARMLLASFEYECTCAILSIASILCVGDIFQNSTRNSKEKKQNISDAIQLFAHPLGDHLTYLKVYTSFLENQKSKQWCEENYINYRAMKRAVEIRKQLKRYVKRFAIDSNKTLKKDFEHNNNNNNKEEEEEEESHLILQCILTGFFANAAKLDPTGTYRTVRDNRAVQIHPSSVYAFFGNVPEYITYHQSVLSSEEYIRDISKIDPRWLLQIAPDFYQSKELSSKISGSSGTLGLPKNTSRMMQPQNKKQQQQQTSTSETGGRILFRKPTATTAATNKTTKSKLPVHIGKSKGGLRSQF